MIFFCDGFAVIPFLFVFCFKLNKQVSYLNTLSMCHSIIMLYFRYNVFSKNFQAKNRILLYGCCLGPDVLRFLRHRPTLVYTVDSILVVHVLGTWCSSFFKV